MHYILIMGFPQHLFSAPPLPTQERVGDSLYFSPFRKQTNTPNKPEYKKEEKSTRHMLFLNLHLSPGMVPSA